MTFWIIGQYRLVSSGEIYSINGDKARDLKLYFARNPGKMYILMRKIMSTELQPVIKALDDVRHSPDSETEYWMARDIQGILGYTDWRNFEG